MLYVTNRNPVRFWVRVLCGYLHVSTFQQNRYTRTAVYNHNKQCHVAYVILRTTKRIPVRGNVRRVPKELCVIIVIIIYHVHTTYTYYYERTRARVCVYGASVHVNYGRGLVYTHGRRIKILMTPFLVIAMKSDP